MGKVSTPGGRLKLLVSAYSCDAGDVGSAYRAFHWVKALSAHCDITLMTRRRGGKPCGTEGLPNVRTVYFDESPIYGKFVRFDRRFQPGYFSFTLRSYFAAGKELEKERYDLVHQITPGAQRYPSTMAFLGIPFVLGPVGGVHPYPKELAGAFSRDAVELLRRADSLRFSWDPFLRGTLARAKKLLLFSEESVNCLPEEFRGKCSVMADGGFEALPERATGGGDVFQMLYVGRIEVFKGLRFVLRAVAKARIASEWSLTVVGDGPDLEYEKKLARELGISGKVRFEGRKPRREVDEYYGRSDVFCFASVREPAGQVVLEAMSYGLPVVVCDYAGPGASVTAECGFKIKPAAPEAFVAEMAKAIEALANSPELRARMGEAARKRIRDEFIWEKRAERMIAIYREVLGEGGK